MAITAMGVWLYFKDDKLGDHSDLEPDPVHLPGGTAAFEAWLVAASKNDDTEWRALTDADSFYKSLAGDAPWDAQAAEKILSTNREALDLAFAADKLGPIALLRQSDASASVSYFGEFQALSKNLRVLAIERAVAGDFPAAVEAAGVGLRFGEGMVEGQANLLGFLVGSTQIAIGEAAIDSILLHDPPEAVLASLGEMLVKESDLAAVFRDVARTEFKLYADSMGKGGELAPYGFIGPDKPPPRFLMKPNRTTNQGADVFRALIADAAKPVAGRSSGPGLVDPTGLAKFSSNAFGDYINAQSFDSHWNILEGADTGLARRRQLRTKLALIRYRKAEGRLPAALADLVPKYLDAVPTDPYDANALRYDPVRGAIWVIGKDLIDGGGAAAYDPSSHHGRMPDPTLFVDTSP